MAALLLKRLTLQTIKTENNCISRCLGKYILHKTIPAQLSLGASVPRLSYLVHAKAFSTAADTQDGRKKKKKSEPAFSNIGRKIHERVIHVLDEAGNDLGNMHRADVIRLMNERDLRLVKRDSGVEPPQYQLLTGAQIHREQLRLRELEKARPKPGRCRAVCKRSPRDHRPAVESGICQGAHDRGDVKKQGHSRSHHQCPHLSSALPYFRSSSFSLDALWSAFFSFKPV